MQSEEGFISRELSVGSRSALLSKEHFLEIVRTEGLSFTHAVLDTYGVPRRGIIKELLDDKKRY